MQKPYVKIFHEERELNIVVCSILNGSVHFGTTKFKQEIIGEIATILSYSTIKNSDVFSSLIYTDKLEYSSKPSKKLNAVQSNLKEILEFNPLKKGVDFDFIAKSIFKRVKRKSIIFIIGDFFEIPDFRLLAKKHEIIAIIVRDKMEENPPNFGLATLQDPETGIELDGDYGTNTINNYISSVKKHDYLLSEKFLKENIKFKKIYTDDNVWSKLKQFI